MKPLQGITILDVTRLLPGAVASMMLGDAGAEIIKIVHPNVVHSSNLATVLFDETLATAMDKSSKKIAIDLKSNEGREEFLRLIEKADVLIENFRPDVMSNLKIDYEVLKEINPRLIYCSITGYGKNGELSKRPGHDLNFVAMAGMLGNPPVVPEYQVGDIAGGSLHAVINILLAIIEREKTGRGGQIDISMTDSLAIIMLAPRLARLSNDPRAMRGFNLVRGGFACYNIYKTGDANSERYIAAAALEPKFWKNLCRVIERDDLVDQQYVDDAQLYVIGELKNIFQSKSLDEWLTLFNDVDACVTPVN